MSPPNIRILEAAQSAALTSSNSEIAAQLLRDLPGNERNALRDYYAGDGDEQQICTRYAIAPAAFQALKTTLRARFRDLRSAETRKPAGSAPSAIPARLARGGFPRISVSSRKSGN